MRANSRFFVDAYELREHCKPINFVEVICLATGKNVMPAVYVPNISQDQK